MAFPSIGSNVGLSGLIAESGKTFNADVQLVSGEQSVGLSAYTPNTGDTKGQQLVDPTDTRFQVNFAGRIRPGADHGLTSVGTSSGRGTVTWKTGRETVTKTVLLRHLRFEVSESDQVARISGTMLLAEAVPGDEADTEIAAGISIRESGDRDYKRYIVRYRRRGIDMTSYAGSSAREAQALRAIAASVKSDHSSFNSTPAQFAMPYSVNDDTVDCDVYYFHQPLEAFKRTADQRLRAYGRTVQVERWQEYDLAHWLDGTAQASTPTMSEPEVREEPATLLHLTYIESTNPVSKYESHLGKYNGSSWEGASAKTVKFLTYDVGWSDADDDYIVTLMWEHRPKGHHRDVVPLVGNARDFSAFERRPDATNLETIDFSTVFPDPVT